MNKHIIALLAALGRPIADADNASEAQLVTALNEAVAPAKVLVVDACKLATAEAGRVTAVNEVAVLKTQLTAANGQVTTAVNEVAGLKTSLATERAARAGVVLTVAVNEGRLTEAQKPDWLSKLTAPGADFGAVEGDLKKLKKAVNTKSAGGSLAGRNAPTGDQNKVRAINEALAVEMKETGATRLVAMSALRTKKPDLFEADEK